MTGSPWPLDKIQGFLLRGYNMLLVRHLAVSVKNVEAAREALAAMVGSGEGILKVTTAEPWGAVKPTYCMTAGFTYRGLRKLCVDQAALDAFNKWPQYQPFVQGSAQRAAYVGDTGTSAPSNWVLSDSDFDLMLSLYINDETMLEEVTQQLLSQIGGGFTVSQPRIFDTQVLYDGQVYFGYEDGIGQPIIDGSPFSSEPDGGQDLVDPGAFMLGTARTLFYSFPQPQPPVFGMYGCFGAFRVLHQDVEGFEAQVDGLATANAEMLGITDHEIAKQAIKALICGRWANGTSLADFPIQGDKLPPPLPSQKINDFEYKLPDGSMDFGKVCPVGCHARRGNMRLSLPNDSNPQFPGAPSKNHRILRRAMPYQSPYRPEDRDDPKTERGLAGFFLGTSFLDQFEFVQHNWINARFYTDLPGTADPLMGAENPRGLAFPSAPRDIKRKIAPLASFVRTKASAYLFFPGIDGIRYVADPKAGVS
jgi:deferrochelatase/peroxidase EfeB